jgi:hypothetical protein
MVSRVKYTRVARLSLEHDTKNRKNVPKEHKMYQMFIKYLKCAQNTSNGHKIFQLSKSKGQGMENAGIHILWQFVIYYGHLVYFMDIW